METTLLNTPANQPTQTQENQFKIKQTEEKKTSIDTKNQQQSYTKKHEFWDTQPVPKEGETGEEGEITKAQELENVRQNPLPLLDHFEWTEFDMNKDTDVDEIHKFLNENYIEDGNGLFRLNYSKEFLRWALTPPGYYPEAILGVRVKKNKKLVGFITGIPVNITVNGIKIRIGQNNFLCVHKKLRSSRLTPVLIKEITRRVHFFGFHHSIYTSGTRLPSPFLQAKYFHRSLNLKKLIDIKFVNHPSNQPITRLLKLYRISEELKVQGIREFKTEDIPQVTKLLEEYLSKFKVHYDFTEEEVKHWFLPQKDIMYSYVVEKDNKITDFISFYSLVSSVLDHPKHKQLKTAYSFYNVANSIPLVDLMNAALTLAANENFDLFSALNIFDNAKIFEELKFTLGEGDVNYYFYNWRLASAVEPNEVAAVLF